MAKANQRSIYRDTGEMAGINKIFIVKMAWRVNGILKILINPSAGFDADNSG